MKSHKLTAKDFQIIRLALAEDLGSQGDITSRKLISSTKKGEAVIVARERGIFCGEKVIHEIIRVGKFKITPRFYIRDGDKFLSGKKIILIKGDVRDILAAERTILNFAGHLSGVSTITAQFVAMLKNYQVKILDTRKTMPGLRGFEKYAVRVGGGFNHRMGLWDEVFVKENHRVYGDLNKLRVSPGKFVIEVRNQRELEAALQLKPRVILLDNYKPNKLSKAVRFAREINRNVLLEASGGINLSNIRRYAATGVDQISIGALTHSVKSIDFSLLMRP